jgi:hypothetical protein
MSIDFDVRGLGELQRELERMQEGMTTPVVNDWCKRIEQGAKESCPAEERESIHIGALPVEHNKFEIQFKSSRNALPHVRDSIQRNLPSMPVTTRAIFEAFLKQVEKQMSEEEAPPT